MLHLSSHHAQCDSGRVTEPPDIAASLFTFRVQRVTLNSVPFQLGAISTRSQSTGPCLSGMAAVTDHDTWRVDLFTTVHR